MIARLVALTLAAGLCALPFACAESPDKRRETAVIAPSFELYVKSGVDLYLTRRCGTLDCHGAPGRPLRFYSTFGLRIYSEDAALVPGAQPTTQEELRANYESVIGLEPEQMSRVVAEGAPDPRQLILLRKPLFEEFAGGERHKGGPVMALNDDGYVCLSAWLAAPPDAKDLGPAEQNCRNAGAVR